MVNSLDSRTILREARDALATHHCWDWQSKTPEQFNWASHKELLPNCDDCELLTRLDAELAKVAEPVATIPEVDAMVSSIENALDALYRRKPTDIHDGLGDHLGADQWDSLNRALTTAKKVSELVHLMEENSLAEGPVVLDLSEVNWILAHQRQYFNGPDLLAAIRAQLKDVVVKC